METPKKKGRGPGKRPRLTCTSIRLSVEVMEYFDKHYQNKKQAKMREVLAKYVSEQLKEKQDGTHPNVQE
jgi:hypothetical protein